MPLRLPRFRLRLRTILIAMVVIGFVASRCEVDTARGLVIKMHGSKSCYLLVMAMNAEARRTAQPPIPHRLMFFYVDRENQAHHIAGMFSFHSCWKCTKRWQWNEDRQRYVDEWWRATCGGW